MKFNDNDLPGKITAGGTPRKTDPFPRDKQYLQTPSQPEPYGSGSPQELRKQLDASEREIASLRSQLETARDLAKSGADTAKQVKELREKTVAKLKEQQDLIDQVVGAPKLSGIVLDVNPSKFSEFDFAENMEVRIVRGTRAGQYGKLVSLKDTEEEYMGTVEFFAGGTHEFVLVRKWTNPSIIMSDGTEKENPNPWDYQIGDRVKAADTLIVCAVVNEKGCLTVQNPKGDLSDLWVGVDSFVSPSSKDAGQVYVAIEGRLVSMKMPREFEVNRGDIVGVNPQTMEIVSVGGLPTYGETVVFEDWTPDGLMEITMGSSTGTKLVYCLLSPNERSLLEKKDRVVLDMTNSVALKRLDAKSLAANMEKRTTGIRWDDIAGCRDAKSALRESIEFPVIHKELYEFYGKKPSKGILLYGAPGNGKTMLAKAACTALADAYGGDSGEGFLYVKGSEILSQWVGAAEAKVRQLFETARQFKETNGYPAILFIDEAEAILGKRGSMRSSDVDRTIVPMFLAEMDGLDDSGCIVLLATNRPNSLDPAVTREGRIDKKIKIGRPDAETATLIIAKGLAKRPTSAPVEKLAEMAVELIMNSDEFTLYSLDFADGSKDAVHLRDIVSGAMCANLVETATSHALLRDLAMGTRTGVSEADIEAAVREAYESNREVNHDDELEDKIAGRQLRKMAKAGER